MNKGQICWSCQHCGYGTAEPNYSEYTPGNDFSLYCRNNHWRFNNYNDSLEDFKDKLMTAETCKDFQLHETIK